MMYKGNNFGGKVCSGKFDSSMNLFCLRANQSDVIKKAKRR